MAIKFPKVNWEKVGAYAFGGLLGGGLSALAWHVMEKHGVNPGMIFKKKVVQGNITYYDPEKDPNVAGMLDDLEEEELDEGDGINEDYVEDEEDPVDENEEEEKPGIYQIDAETWYRSEDDEGYKHAEMKYWIENQQITDENDKFIPKPWLLIGAENYDLLADENSDREMFVRNEGLETDFCITRTEGSFE